MPRRTYPGQRLVRILLRTGHIAAAALVIGSAVRGEHPQDSILALLLTGGAITLDFIWRDGEDWFRFLGSWVVLLKLVLMTAALVWPDFLEWACWSALVLGGLISHAPGRIRQLPLWGAAGPCASAKSAESCRPRIVGDGTEERALAHSQGRSQKSNSVEPPVHLL